MATLAPSLARRLAIAAPIPAEPLGLNNIDRFLKMGPYCLEGQKGCFAINSMREFAILPPKAVGIIARSRTRLKHLIARHAE
jgi:TetR/AcrR family transcriptional regulator, copper-responsive repressor